MAFLALGLLFLIGTTCGLPSHKIIGGEISEKGRWPWMLSLQRLRESGEFTHTCGAALLTSNWILTAAHCVTASPNPGDYRVLVGAFQNDGSDSEDLVYLKTIILHEDYDPSNPPGVPNDVAVAELEREVDLTLPGVGLGQLPRHGDSFVGNPNCVATGWGRFDPDEQEGSPVLRELRATVWSRTQCQLMWENLYPGYGNYIFEEHVCIAGPDDGVCHGDSGSPFNCDMTGEGDWVIAAVASWASGSRCIGATGVYASVEYFLDWVESKVPGLPGAKP